MTYLFRQGTSSKFLQKVTSFDLGKLNLANSGIDLRKAILSLKTFRSWDYIMNSKSDFCKVNTILSENAIALKNLGASLRTIMDSPKHMPVDKVP